MEVKGLKLRAKVVKTPVLKERKLKKLVDAIQLVHLCQSRYIILTYGLVNMSFILLDLQQTIHRLFNLLVSKQAIR